MSELQSKDVVEGLVLQLSEPVIKKARGKCRAMAKAKLVYYPAEKGKPPIEGKEIFSFESPIGPIEKDELKWYIECYYIWPAGPFKDRAQKAEKDLPVWGKAIYDEVFSRVSAHNVLSAWAHATGTKRRFTVSIDSRMVEGTKEKRQLEANEAASELLSLPWELMHDGKEYMFQGAKPVQVRRQLPNTKELESIVSEPPIRILSVSPRPDDESAGYIDHRISAIPLVEAMENLGGLVELTVLTPATFHALEKELDNAQQKGTPYHVIHFDGHGTFYEDKGMGALCFEDPADVDKIEERGVELIDARKLAAMIKDYRIPLFFLEACQSAMTEHDPTASVAAALLNEGAASVVAMSYTVLVETSHRFVKAFYKELAGGSRIGDAMLAGHRALHSDPKRFKIFGAGELELQDWFVPVLYQEKEDVALFKGMASSISPEEVRKTREAGYGKLPPVPEHRFTGRSRELLSMERMLEQQSYIVICGQGGEGKTTIAAELGRWLIRTRRFERAVFVCVEDVYDVRTVVDRIGQQLVENYSVAQFPDAELMTGALVPIEVELKKRKTLLVLDNMESILPPVGKPAGDLTDYTVQLEPEELEVFFQLCQKLNAVGDTRLVFTSREELPPPFDGEKNHFELWRLSQSDAIKLVMDVMANAGIFPKEEEPGGTPPNVEALVEAVNCHARSLVLIAPYVGEMGVNQTKENLEQLMIILHQKHPDDRERSVFACVELSLRRLSPWVREAIKPLAVFRGGGHIATIQMVLNLDENKQTELVSELLQTRLVEFMPYNYLRFHPALSPYLHQELDEVELAEYTTRWAKCMMEMSFFLYRQQSQDSRVSSALTLLELPNLVFLLEYVEELGNPELTIELSLILEQLIILLGRRHLLAHVIAIQEQERGELTDRSHTRFDSKRAYIERLSETENLQQALEETQALLEQCSNAGDTAYPEASYDLAGAHFLMGRLLKKGRACEAAIPFIEEAYRRFQVLAEQGNQSAAGMASASLAEKGDCLFLLGRLEESADAYRQKIEIDAELNNVRGLANGKAQLGTVRMYQGKLKDALGAHRDAMELFNSLGELSSVAKAWHQIGMAHEEAEHWADAEEAYRQSLAIEVQQHDSAGEASSLNQLGNLYDKMNRWEEAVVFYRQAVEKRVDMHDRAKEGLCRSNMAITLVTLERYDEARKEILRAIECKENLGHSAQLWKAYQILSDLERKVGNESTMHHAWEQAFQLYLSYRRDGGENHYLEGEVCTRVVQLMESMTPKEIGKMLCEQNANVKAGDSYKLFLSKLLLILAGSRDRALVEDTNLIYHGAVELTLLLEKLKKMESGTSKK